MIRDTPPTEVHLQQDTPPGYSTGRGTTPGYVQQRDTPPGYVQQRDTPPGYGGREAYTPPGYGGREAYTPPGYERGVHTRVYTTLPTLGTPCTYPPCRTVLVNGAALLVGLTGSPGLNSEIN